MKGYQVFLWFVALRILSVFVVRTWYVPDEYWQSLEVGHKLTFGYGHLTWEWRNGIRSFIHPVIIAGLYKFLEMLDLDKVELLVLVPRILQALISAFADYRFYKWCNRSKWSVFIISTCWFWFYTGSRTLSNTLETSLTTIALSLFPWQSEGAAFIWPVALSVFMRPTALIPWLPLCCYHLKKSKISALKLLFTRYLPIGLLIASVSIAVDSYFLDKLVVTPWEFLKVNVINEIGSFYGEHPWHWYFTTGLTTVLGINTIPFLFATTAIIRQRAPIGVRKMLLISIAVTLAVLSALPHKEFRFVLPLLPMCAYIVVMYISHWSIKASKAGIWTVATALLVLNVVPATYVGWFHQRGSIEVMPKLAELARHHKTDSKFLFLMPCHSTPFYSHLHENVTMRFLTCEPNFEGKENYVDEAERFFGNPAGWLRSHIPVYPPHSLPSHLILFDVLVPHIEEFLKHYNLLETLPHSNIASERQGTNIHIYERNNLKPIKEQQNDNMFGAAETDDTMEEDEVESIKNVEL